MVGGTHDNPTVAFAGESPDFHGSFGIDRQPQHRFILTRLFMHLAQLLKNSVGLLYFF